MSERSPSPGAPIPAARQRPGAPPADPRVGEIAEELRQLAEAFGLTLELARSVVDGELSLEEAVEHTEAAAVARRAAAPSRSPEPALRPPAAAHAVVSPPPPAPEPRAVSPPPAPAPEPRRVSPPPAPAAAGRVPPAAAEPGPGRHADELSQLVEIYGLPVHLGKMVVDRRLTLEAALQQQKRNLERRRRELARENAARRRRRAPVTRAARSAARRRRRAGPRIAVALVVLAAASGAAAIGWMRWSDQVDTVRRVEELARATAARTEMAAPVAAPSSAAPAASRATVDRDGLGRVVRVSGPNPLEVLTAYCESGAPLERRAPMELAQSVPRRPGTRVGVYSQVSEDGLFALRIRRDDETGVWSAGDGITPIGLDPVVPNAVGEPRVPVVAAARGR